MTRNLQSFDVRWITCQVLALLLVMAGTSCSVRGADDLLTLATTTSTENSGLLAYLHPDFQRQTGIRVKVVAKGTGASLQLARDGNADVVLVHDREREDKFVADGHGVLRRDVMYNDFVILGPATDPARVQGTQDPVDAFRRIASARQPFVSRGDQSGTHLCEQRFWQRTGLTLQTERVTAFAEGEETTSEVVRPSGDWYWSIGQGMGKAIGVANEKRAYTLADRGTYYAYALAEPSRTDLQILCERHPSLHNPYGVFAVNPRRHPHVNFAGAKKYIEWITSPLVQKMIADYRLQGRVLFHPSAHQP
ncbi:MAG: tungsten ABC transporter substrate-binding protein [Planctomycetes bacterium]|nr:tungsten ABC transporter substrate-binding protein [Planctomycetota bacterium]